MPSLVAALLAATVCALVLFCIYFLYGARLLSWIGRACCRVRVLSRLSPVPRQQPHPRPPSAASQAPVTVSSSPSLPTKRVVITLDDAPWPSRINEGNSGSRSASGSDAGDDDESVDDGEYSLLDSLDIARAHGAHITLMVIGQHLANAPTRIQDELRARVAAGEVSLANHGDTGACDVLISLGLLSLVNRFRLRAALPSSVELHELL